jgi:hypothetical protein
LACLEHDPHEETLGDYRELLYGEMRDDREKIRKLECVIALLRGELPEGSGSIYSVEYSGVLFNISRRFIVADLSPLTFFHLVAHIDEAGPAAAIVCLYEQLAPLLRRQSDKHLLGWGRDTAYGPHICKLCTAYALSGSLPTVGKTV